MQTDPHDLAVLRSLAAALAEAAQSPEQAKRERLWRRLDDLRPERPVALCSPEGAWDELMPEATLQS